MKKYKSSQSLPISHKNEILKATKHIHFSCSFLPCCCNIKTSHSSTHHSFNKFTRVLHIIMENVVRFNVRGMQYDVCRSLLEMYPSSMLAQCASVQGQTNPGGEVLLWRGGDRFNYVPDYLQGDRYVYLLANVLMSAFLSDLIYYGIEVDKCRIVCNYDSVAGTATWMKDTIKSWRINISILNFIEHCASKFVKTGQLSFIILLIRLHQLVMSSKLKNCGMLFQH